MLINCSRLDNMQVYCYPDLINTILKFVILYYYSGVYSNLGFRQICHPILLFGCVPLLVFHDLSIVYYYSGMYSYSEHKSSLLSIEEHRSQYIRGGFRRGPTQPRPPFCSQTEEKMAHLTPKFG